MAAKKKRIKQKANGPYLASAVFCDNILEGADGAISAIRIVDHITVTVAADAPADVPSESKRLPVTVWTLIGFKTGRARGKHDVNLVMHSPSGKKSQPAEQRTLELGNEEYGGANLKVRMHIAVKEGGLFWFDVLLDGKVVTRMPLQITVTRESPTPAKSSIDKKTKRK